MAIYRSAVDDEQNNSEPVVRPGPQAQDEIKDAIPSRPASRRGTTLEHSRMSFRDSTQHINASIINFMQENEEIQNFNKLRLLCGDIVNHPKAQLFIIVLIVVNAFMMGVGTFDFVTENPAVEAAFETTDLVFLYIFTFELGLQMVFRGYTLFMDGWLVFDLLIVVLSWSFAQLQIIRAFRIFRALRIITRIETMRNLVMALFDIMPRLGAITALLLLIFYIFAVLFTQLFGELELSGDYFNRLDHSLLTLFVMMTMEWADIARECMDQLWWAWAPFVIFIMITGFIVFNLIIAVVCDAVAVIENKEDLKPDIFSMLESKDVGEDSSEFFPHDAANPNGATYEDELVENLALRMSSVLKSQREMLATLEALTEESLVPSQPLEDRDLSEEEDKMSESS